MKDHIVGRHTAGGVLCKEWEPIPTQSCWVGKGFQGKEESTDLMFAENIPILKIN